MAAKLPFPSLAELPDRVLFHRDHPADPIVILQIPNAENTDSATYKINFEDAADNLWFDYLPNYENLRYLLSMEQHVVYHPRTGAMRAIDDLDQPTETELRLNQARRERSQFMGFDTRRSNRVVTSNLRNILGGVRNNP